MATPSRDEAIIALARDTGAAVEAAGRAIDELRADMREIADRDEEGHAALQAGFDRYTDEVKRLADLLPRLVSILDRDAARRDELAAAVERERVEAGERAKLLVQEAAQRAAADAKLEEAARARFRTQVYTLAAFLVGALVYALAGYAGLPTFGGGDVPIPIP